MSDQLEKIRGIIGSILRIGLGGPQIKATGGNLEMRNAVDGGFVITRGADPVGSDDLVTKRYGVATYGAPLLFGAGDVLRSSMRKCRPMRWGFPTEVRASSSLQRVALCRLWHVVR